MAQIKVQGTVTPIPQIDHKPCWLACYQMLYKWRSKPVSDITTKLTNAGISTTTTLADDKQTVAATALGLLPCIHHFVSTTASLKTWLELVGPLKVSV